MFFSFDYLIKVLLFKLLTTKFKYYINSIDRLILRAPHFLLFSMKYIHFGNISEFLTKSIMNMFFSINGSHLNIFLLK